MKEVILQISDNDYSIFLNMIKNNNLSVNIISENNIKKEDKVSKKEILTAIKEGFEEIKQIKEGKKQEISLKDFLDNLE